MRGVISFSLNKTDEEVVEAVRVAYSDFEDGIRLRNDPFAKWRSEVIEKCLNGRIKNDAINVAGYAIACEQNTKLAKANRETNFISVNDAEHGFKGISENSPDVRRYCTNNVEDRLEVIMANEEREIIKAKYYEVSEEIAIEEGVNLQTLIRKSRDNRDARLVKKLKILMEKYEMQELITYILRNEELLIELDIKDEEILPLPHQGVDQSEVLNGSLGRERQLACVG